MNLSPPMNINAYKKTETILYDNYKTVAHDEMKNITQDIGEIKHGKNFPEDEVVDIDASFDVTWQKRGHPSLNGIATAISRDICKCLDYRVMSKNCCSGCCIWKDKEGQQNMIVFLLTINVLPTFKGSAGVLKYFQESLDIHKVRITNFIGDRDSKSHAGVVKADPYPGVVVKKFECSETESVYIRKP